MICWKVKNASELMSAIPLMSRPGAPGQPVELRKGRSGWRTGGVRRAIGWSERRAGAGSSRSCLERLVNQIS